MKELAGVLSDKRISANIEQSVTELLSRSMAARHTFSGTGPEPAQPGSLRMAR